MTIGKAPSSEYDLKAPGYFTEVRPEMLEFIPLSCKRILDVGCAGGGFGATLKRSRNVEVWGVEPAKAAATEAATKLDSVIHGFFQDDMKLPEGSFDCVVFNDVLEHMTDSDSSNALVYARKLLTPEGVIVASIPNMRHFPSLWALIVRKEWTYRDYGILDRTHLRFFTINSIGSFFETNGFKIQTLQGITDYVSPYPNEYYLWRYFRILNTLTLGALGDMKFLQFAVVAQPRRSII